MKLLPTSALCCALAVSAYGGQQDELARLVAQGGDYVRAGQLADAEPVLERAVAISAQGALPDSAKAAAYVARGDLYHALADREGSTPSWNDLAGLDYWHAQELLKDSPDPRPAADALIRWTSTIERPATAAPGNLIPAFLDTLLTTALKDLENAQGDTGLAIELTKTQLVRINRATKRRDRIDRFCPTALASGNQIGLLTECSEAALDAGNFDAAESFAKRVDGLFAGGPAASFARDRVRTSLVLAESALKQGRVEDARNAADQAVALSREYLGENHQLRANSLKTQANVLDQLKRRAESKQALTEAARIEAANKKHTANPRLVAVHPVSTDKPIYPPQAQTSHVGGRIFVLCEIATDGTTRVLAPFNQLGYGLDDAVVAAIRQWTFDPMKKDGQPVPSIGVMQFTFRPN